MAFIDKKDPVVLNIKLTTCGRQLLSTGNLTFKYFAIGDSEMDYTFNAETGLNAFNARILRPVDVNPNIISYIPQNLSGDPFNLIPSIPASTYIVTNTAQPVGFFQPTTGTSTGFTFIVDSNHIKQPDAMIFMSGITGGTTIYLKKAPTYGTSGAEPAIDDLLLVKWTLTANTTGYTTSKKYPTPFLIYKIVTVSGTLASNTFVITVDRNLPNFSGFTATAVAGAMVLYNFINFSGDTIFNMNPTDYLDESVLTFLQNSQCPTIIFPFWNMSIIFTEEVAGVQPGNITFGEFDTAPYGGFVSYIQNQAPVLKKLGVIHYTNSSPANVYGEGFYLRTPRLDIPTIMWHKSTGRTLGVTLGAIGDVKLLTGTTRSLDLVYYDLADPYGNIVGKQFVDLKIFVIEDQELLFAMSYKANRSWTLPDFVSNVSGGGCVPPPEPIAVLSATTTSESFIPEFQKISTGGQNISGFTNVIEYGIQYRITGSSIWITQSVIGALLVPQFSMVISGLLGNTPYAYRAFVKSGVTGFTANTLTTTTLTVPSVQTTIASGATFNSIINTGGNSIPFDVWSAPNPPFQFYAMQYRKLGDITWLFSPLPPNNGPVSGGTFGGPVNITGLAPNTNYEYRAWIQVDFSQYNGVTQVIHTAFAPAIVPSVTTAPISSFGQISADGGGNVTADGGAFVSQRGVAYGLALNPQITGSTTSDGSGLGNFASSMVGLTPGTLYHVRAYATNSAGTGYGADSAFTTTNIPNSPPTVITSPASPIGQNTATSGGEVTNEGSQPVTVRGIVWSTITTPTIASHIGGGITSDGVGPGVFTSSMVGLITDTFYFVRAYAANGISGTSYGNQITFTTLALPTVTTTAISDWTLSTATTGGNVLDQGIPAVVTARGVAWSTSHNPTIADSHTVDGSGNGSYASNITGLIAGTAYYIRAYATNSTGTAYGAERSIVPQAITLTVSQTSCNTSSFDCNVQGRICYTPALSAGQCVTFCVGFAFRTCYCGSGPAAISDVQFCRNGSIFCTVCNTNPPNVCQPSCHATITINSGDAICYCNYSTSCHGGCNCFNIVALPASLSSVGIVPVIGSPSVSTFSVA